MNKLPRVVRKNMAKKKMEEKFVSHFTQEEIFLTEN